VLMRNKVLTFLILLTTALGSINVVHRIVPIAMATYVEGTITLDTTWTLVDNPFVVSNDIVVAANATLTIEPGVEVRFGGNFSLVVNGAIIAVGTDSRMIRFTTNDPEKQVSWQTILINSSGSSSLIHCIIEYGTNGTTVDNGSVEMQNDTIDSNLENGIVMNDGDLVAANNEISNNTNAGVRLTGGTVDIDDNVIESNGDGVELSGNMTERISIERNKILNNSNGILFEANSYDNTFVSNNTLFKNNYGIRVSSNSSTYIAHNYITNNTIGIYYDEGEAHQAHFNDIFDNELGMDVSSAAGVNATHNYWGNETGPFHTTLNPYANGNPVSGNGVNLDFIFFLTHPFAFEINNTRPTAVLHTDLTLAGVGQPVTFVGSDSYDDGNVDEYFLDFGDGTTSGWTTLTILNHNYSVTGTFTANLKVRDDFGSESENASVTIHVTDLPRIEVSIILSDYTLASGGDIGVSVLVPEAVGSTSQVNLFSVKGGSFSSSSGSTDLSGIFNTMFTAPNVNNAKDIRIIATASLNGHADSSSYEYLKVLPLLKVQVSADPDIIHSAETSNVVVYVSDSLDRPAADVNLTLFLNQGNLTEVNGITDSNGSATFTYLAPETLTPINATVSILAEKEGYAVADGPTKIIVEPKILALGVIIDSPEVISEATSTLVAQVTFDSFPVSGAAVTASSDVGGNFTPTRAYTDLQGFSTIAFSAPRTTMSSGINATIIVRAELHGYVADEQEVTMVIKPRVLSVKISAEPDATFSEGKLNVTVHVGYDKDTIEDANVTIREQNGNLSAREGFTDMNGNVTFTLTAPHANEPSNITIAALGTADGYVENESLLEVSVNPRTFGVQTTASAVRSGETGILVVHTTCNEDASVVEGATIVMLYENGTSQTNTTDSSGTCTFAVVAPQQTAEMLNVTVMAAKSGYSESQTRIEIPFIQTESGLSLMIIFLIAIPVAIVTVIVVLIKLKLIVVSLGDSEQEG
jgi:parallel beta-helix repeat protein